MQDRIYCKRCGINIDVGNVVSLVSKREIYCPSCESAKAEEKWILVMLVVAAALLFGGAVYEWLSMRSV